MASAGLVMSALTEEERIESSKYAGPDTLPRVFEEERFLFPESYEMDRVRLLVKDPEWLFAHWDLSSRSWSALREALGERAFALSRLTLTVEDPADGALSVILLPPGSRSWYVRTHVGHRTYRAELGITIPSGAFRRLAASNVVVTPSVGPAPERTARVAHFGRPVTSAAQAERAREAQVTAQAAQERARSGGGAHRSEPVRVIDAMAAGAEHQAEQGGASDVFARGGASDAFKPGASDTHRR